MCSYRLQIQLQLRLEGKGLFCCFHSSRSIIKISNVNTQMDKIAFILDINLDKWKNW